jgi:FAD/FMN-containing dehydrogenase
VPSVIVEHDQHPPVAEQRAVQPWTARRIGRGEREAHAVDLVLATGEIAQISGRLRRLGRRPDPRGLGLGRLQPGTRGIVVKLSPQW